MSECDRKKFEQMLAFHSAPTLLGVKCANLFAVKRSELSVSDIEEYFRSNTTLRSLSVHVMCRCSERALLYVYHKDLLNMWLCDERVSDLLESHYPQLNSLKDYAFYYDDVKIFECSQILEYCHRQDESEQQIS